jgi:hypothetical protein
VALFIVGLLQVLHFADDVAYNPILISEGVDSQHFIHMSVLLVIDHGVLSLVLAANSLTKSQEVQSLTLAVGMFFVLLNLLLVADLLISFPQNIKDMYLEGQAPFEVMCYDYWL